VEPRKLVVRVALTAAVFAAVFLLLGRLVPGAWERLGQLNAAWLALAFALEAVSLAGYAVLFHAVFARDPARIKRMVSAEVAVGELAGFAFVPTGLGGPALRFWALLRSGVPLRLLIVRTISHAPVLNAPYVVAAIVVGGTALLHVGPGRAPVVLALAPVALVGAAVSLTVGALAAGRRGRPRGPGRWRRMIREGIAIAPDGLRDAWALRSRPLALAGACAYWAGDCGVLWATFHGLGASPPLQVVVLAYMLGQLGNVLPLPGGVGGVEPATVGVLTASGIALAPAAAAVLTYRAISLGMQGAFGTLAFTTLLGADRPAASAS